MASNKIPPEEKGRRILAVRGAREEKTRSYGWKRNPFRREERCEGRNRGLRAKSDVVNVIYLEGKDISISIGGPTCLNSVSTGQSRRMRSSQSSRLSRGPISWKPRSVPPIRFPGKRTNNRRNRSIVGNVNLLEIESSRYEKFFSSAQISGEGEGGGGKGGGRRRERKPIPKII